MRDAGHMAATLSIASSAYSIECMAGLYTVEIEPEVRSWLEQLTDRDFGRADFLVGLLAEHAEDLSEPYPRHLGGKVRELRFHLLRQQTRITYWLAPGRRGILLAVFRKARSAGTAGGARALLLLRGTRPAAPRHPGIPGRARRSTACLPNRPGRTRPAPGPGAVPGRARRPRRYDPARPLPPRSRRRRPHHPPARTHLRSPQRRPHRRDRTTRSLSRQQANSRHQANLRGRAELSALPPRMFMHYLACSLVVLDWPQSAEIAGPALSCMPEDVPFPRIRSALRLRDTGQLVWLCVRSHTGN